MKRNNEYVGIPYTEKIVPFPNFGSMLMQHAREMPDKIALKTAELDISYSQLLQYCISAQLKDDQYDILNLLAKLYKGIPFELKFVIPWSIMKEISIHELQNIDFFEPPYVRLDDKAFILNDTFEFSQYNILVAAQAIGNTFKLFREGAVYCPEGISSVADLMFGVLGPLYFGKSIYFNQKDEPNFFQYAWNGEFESNLRDAVMVSNKVNYHKNAFRLIDSYEQALGLGKVISSGGKDVTFLGFEIDEGEPKGHCLGKKL